MPKFVEVVAQATGNKQMVPAHWVDHPVLGAPFKTKPSARATRSAGSEAKGSTEAKPARDIKEN
jgi:hypothetical protein